jgi:hypothetical protein
MTKIENRFIGYFILVCEGEGRVQHDYFFIQWEKDLHRVGDKREWGDYIVSLLSKRRIDHNLITPFFSCEEEFPCFAGASKWESFAIGVWHVIRVLLVRGNVGQQ